MYSGRRARERRAPLLCSAAVHRCCAPLLCSAVLTAFVACAFTRRTEHAARYRSYSRPRCGAFATQAARGQAGAPLGRRPTGGGAGGSGAAGGEAGARTAAARPFLGVVLLVTGIRDAGDKSELEAELREVEIAGDAAGDAAGVQTFARGGGGGRVCARRLLTQTHKRGPKTHKHRQSRRERDSDGSQKAALGPGKENARAAPLHTCACAQAGAELLEEDQLRSAFAPASASFSPGSSAAALKAKPLAPRHVEKEVSLLLLLLQAKLLGGDLLLVTGGPAKTIKFYFGLALGG